MNDVCRDCVERTTLDHVQSQQTSNSRRDPEEPQRCLHGRSPTPHRKHDIKRSMSKILGSNPHQGRLAVPAHTCSTGVRLWPLRRRDSFATRSLNPESVMMRRSAAVSFAAPSSAALLSSDGLTVSATRW